LVPQIEALENTLARNNHKDNILKHAEYYRDIVFTAMGN